MSRPRYECCNVPIDLAPFCSIDDCRRTDTAHVEGYPDCVWLCPAHAYLSEEDPW